MGMITGAHSIVFSKHPDADREFFRKVLKLPSVDAGGGWLIFGLPPAEVAVHPSNANDVHDLYLMCDDIEALTTDMKRRGIECSAIRNQGWGLLTELTLPGGGKLGVYQPRHARPPSAGVAPRPKRASKREPKKTATRTATIRSKKKRAKK